MTLLPIAMLCTALALEPSDRAPLPRPLAEGASEAIVTGADRVRRAVRPGDEGEPLEAGHPLEDAALAVRAMAVAGVARDDPGFAAAWSVLRSAPLDDVAAVGACVTALDDLDDPADDARIRDAAAWLLDARAAHGLWGGPGRVDVAASEAAVAALERAALAGVELSEALWTGVVDGLLDARLDGGAFGEAGVPTGRATAAAIVVLETAHRRLAARDAAHGTRRRASTAIGEAWDWLEPRFAVVGAPVGAAGDVVDAGRHRYLDVVARAADASGRAALGERAWAPAGAAALLAAQRLDGAWSDRLADTSLAVLFLRRALGPGEVAPRSTPWRATTDAPFGAWKLPDFDDDAWALAYPAFSGRRLVGRDVRGSWPPASMHLWLRRAFSWREGDPEPAFVVDHSGPLEISLNGVYVGRWYAGTDGERVTHGLSAGARRVLVDGRNVVAVKAERDHGEGWADVTLVLRGEAPTRAAPWWRRADGPRPDASFVRRWLVMGPLDVERPDRLHVPLVDEPDVAPRIGQRTRHGRWEETLAPGGFLDLAYVTEDADASVRYAFTWLHAETDVDAVLWIGSDDGVRVWLDGVSVHSHQRDRRARPDDDAVPLRLTAGAHRLLFKVENREKRTGLYARLTDAAGDPLRSVRPALRDERPNWSAVALSHPELFSYAELHVLLTPARADRLDFAKSDVRTDGIALGPAHPGSPAWLPAGVRTRGDGDPTARPPTIPHIPVAFGAPLPHPGARGVLVLRPPTRGVPAQLLRRVRLGDEITARVCADARADPTHAGATFRVGVWRPGDEAPTWLHESIVTSAAVPSEAYWTDVSVPTVDLSGEDVLVVIEAVASPVHLGPDALFLDELSFR